MGAFGTLKLAGQFVFLSAVLHLVAFVMTGFVPIGWWMLAVAVFYTGLSMGLTRGMRALGYAVFVLLLIGIVGGLIQVGSVPVPDWSIWAIIAADLLAVLNLFVALWKPKSV